MKFYFSLLVFLGSVGAVIGQESAPAVEFSATPSVAALAKYADTPVGYYSGTPNINIPLYTINTGGYQLPISLSYNASGIKVAQEASNVGLGWSMNAGGMITRQIRGFDDFHNAGEKTGYFWNQDLYDNGGYLPKEDFLNCSQQLIQLGPDLEFWDVERCTLIKDIEPDLFIFNFGGYSGKFIIQRDLNDLSKGKGLLLDESSNLDIEFDILGNVKNFKITDPNGIVYDFQSKEISISYSWASHTAGEIYEAPQKIDTWYLDKITLTNSQEINFNYSQASTPIVGHTIESEFKNSVLASQGCMNGYINEQYNYSRNEVMVAYELDSIDWDDGQVIFNKSNREDYNKQKISSVQVLDANSNEIKTYGFTYGYFNDSYLGGNPTEKRENLRLKLEQLQETTNSSIIASIPPSVFSYNEEYSLPSKTSTRYDYWGYFNNKYYISRIPALRYESDEFGIIDFPGANRKSDFNYAITATLESIHYPESGIVNYEYELNDYFAPEDDPIYLTNSNSGNIEHYDSYGDPFVTYDDSDGTPLNYYGFQINGVLTEFTLRMDLDISFFSAADYLLMYLLKLEDDGTETIIGYINNTDGIEFDDQGNVVWEEGENEKTAHKTFYPEASSGNYRVRFNDWHMPGYADDNVALTGSISYTEELTELETASKAGGLRVKKISSPKNTREFSYSQHNDNLQEDTSSGILISKPNFHVEYSDVNNLSAAGCNITTYNRILRRQSDSNYPISGTITGNIVGYSEVTETIKNPNYSSGDIKTVYKYKNQAEYRSGINAPNYPRLDNGKLLETLKYKGSFLVKEEKYNYTLGSSWDETHGIGYWSPSSEHTSSFIYYYDIPTHAMVILDQITTKDYYSVSYPPIESTINYFYNYEYGTAQLHKLPYRKAVSTSDGSYLVNNYYYPEDISTLSNVSSTELSAANALVANNRLNTPIQTNTYKADNVGFPSGYKLLNSNRLSFKQENGLILPDLFKASVGNENLENKVKYERYNDQGDILETSNPESNVHTSYIWGYNNQYPIAKIGNASFADIESLSSFGSNFLISEGLSTIQEQQLRSLPNVLLTTYTYKPLVGITSMTDTNGYTMTYHYDAHNRLEYVTDHNGDVLSKNEYYYKNQQ